MIIHIDNTEYWDADKVQEYVGESYQSLYYKIKCQAFPQPMKLTSRIFWRKEEIEKFMKDKKEE